MRLVGHTFFTVLAEFVDAEELTCPGVKDCHVTANAKSSEAHRMKDLSAICQ